jgi:SAM-dependent MidA family methyltransferase
VSQLAERLAERIARHGPLPLDQFIDAALYDVGGFYASGASAGRRGDFITSPEVGPLFGAVVARALDAWWVGLGRPDPYVVVEAGAGPGTLARAVLAARPACAAALRYVLVERTAAQRSRHGPGLPLVPPAEAFVGSDDDAAAESDDGAFARGDAAFVGDDDAALAGDDDPPAEVDADGRGHAGGSSASANIGRAGGSSASANIGRAGGSPASANIGRAGGSPASARTGRGPLCVSLGELPAVRFTGVVIANELLDNLAFGLLVQDDGWREARVGVGDDGRFVELLVPPSGPLPRGLPSTAPLGARVPVQRGAAAWLDDALAHLERGRVVAFDYTSTTAAMASRPWREWLRTYREHERGGHYLREPGTQDITCEVALDQLGREPDAVRTQAQWLQLHGIDELVEEGRRRWREQAHVGDLDALRARSRVAEAEALLDPAGLGGFTVAEWSKI